jgi:hypothetical protein
VAAKLAAPGLPGLQSAPEYGDPCSMRGADRIMESNRTHEAQCLALGGVSVTAGISSAGRHRCTP